MPLTKSIALLNGITADHIEIGNCSIRPLDREAVIQFNLFLSAAQYAAMPNAPLGIIAELRLIGGKYDQYFGSDVLNTNPNIIQHIFEAAQAEPLLPGMGFNMTNFPGFADGTLSAARSRKSRSLSLSRRLKTRAPVRRKKSRKR